MDEAASAPSTGGFRLLSANRRGTRLMRAPFPVGSYRLEIRVTDNPSGAVAMRDVRFTVQPAAP